MANNDDNMIVQGGDSSNYDIITVYSGASGGPTGHFQMMGLAYEQTTGGAYTYVSETAGLPVRIPAASNIGVKISELHECITGDGTAGLTAIGVDIISSAGLTINAIVEDLVFGVTTDVTRANVGVYGTGGTAVGITGSVYVLGVADVKSTSGITVHGSGGGDIVVGGIMGITTNQPYAQIGVYGTGGTAVGVTGTVKTDPTSLIGISGGVVVTSITEEIPIQQPSGMTNGSIESALNSGVTLGAHGLSSGVRIQAFSTGSSAEYVYVGASASTVPYAGADGLTHKGYPLREMDSVFIEIDNTGKVAIVSDNSAAKIRYIGS